jgi:Mn2+-dependent serine/threonine protein kinase
MIFPSRVDYIEFLMPDMSRHPAFLKWARKMRKQKQAKPKKRKIRLTKKANPKTTRNIKPACAKSLELVPNPKPNRTTKMIFPSRADYIDLIVPNLSRFAKNERIRRGTTRLNKKGDLFFRQGGLALTFPIDTDDGSAYAFRVWFNDPGDLSRRYAAVHALNNESHPWFVKTWYEERGVQFKNQHYPSLCMEWMEGETLEDFIEKWHADQHLMRSMAKAFLHLVKLLHESKISHGDLQQGNIMLVKSPDDNSYYMYLVDYDSIWTPSLGDMPDTTAGLRGYQHPLRNRFPHLKEKTDYFSEMVIYLSLLAIAENSMRWLRVQGTGRLLFDFDDFTDTKKSSVFATLKKSQSEEIRRLTDWLEMYCEQTDLSRLPPLEAVVDGTAGEISDWRPKEEPIPAPPFMGKPYTGVGIIWELPPTPATDTSAPPQSGSPPRTAIIWNQNSGSIPKPEQKKKVFKLPQKTAQQTPQNPAQNPAPFPARAAPPSTSNQPVQEWFETAAGHWLAVITIILIMLFFLVAFG